MIEPVGNHVAIVVDGAGVVGPGQSDDAAGFGLGDEAGDGVIRSAIWDVARLNRECLRRSAAAPVVGGYRARKRLASLGRRPADDSVGTERYADCRSVDAGVVEGQRDGVTRVRIGCQWRVGPLRFGDRRPDGAGRDPRGTVLNRRIDDVDGEGLCRRAAASVVGGDDEVD